jgi:hypothetical protein
MCSGCGNYVVLTYKARAQGIFVCTGAVVVGKKGVVIREFKHARANIVGVLWSVRLR